MAIYSDLQTPGCQIQLSATLQEKQLHLCKGTGEELKGASTQGVDAALGVTMAKGEATQTGCQSKPRVVRNNWKVHPAKEKEL